MGRRTNLALAVLLVTAVISGLASQAIGVDWPLDTAVIHGAVALAILLLSPWKTSIVRRGLKKKRPGRVFSLILLTVVLITLASGLLHAHGEISRIGPLTVMQIHVGGAVLALGLAIDHFRRHPVTPRTFRCRPPSIPANLSAVGGGGSHLARLGGDPPGAGGTGEGAPVHRHARERVT